MRGPKSTLDRQRRAGTVPCLLAPFALSFVGLSRNNERDRVEIRGLTSSWRNADGLQRPFGFLAKRWRKRGTRARAREGVTCRYRGATVDECKQIFYGLLSRASNIRPETDELLRRHVGAIHLEEFELRWRDGHWGSWDEVAIMG